jgi:hypothetical protein
MKIFQFYKTGFFTLLILFTLISPALSNPFYDLLPDSKREEIKIIDEHTVEIGIGPDNRSVSCNILDAIHSIPYVGSDLEPATVFVNNEKIHHFRKGLYTWDREGKYRVRLTTKYIREFGNIRIHVPKEEATLPKQLKLSSTGPTSLYFQNLPQNIKEEITIIDKNMVEVAIGPDDRSVSATLLHAIQSIPSLKEGMEPDQVFVNGEQIYHIKKGVYAWDAKGRNPVRLTTKFIRKFGNIQIHVAGEEPLPLLKDEPMARIEAIAPPKPEQAQQKEPVDSPKPETLPPIKPTEISKKKTQEKEITKEVTDEKPKIILAPEVIAPPPNVKGESINQPDSSSPPIPKKIRMGIVKGFRLAQFGMSEQQVIKAIEADFGLLENKVARQRGPEPYKHILTIVSLTLDPKNGKALIHYYFSSHDPQLNRVDVVWGHPDHSNADKTILQNSAAKLKNLFTQLRQLETKKTNTDTNPYIFYGIDTSGNGIKMMWAKPLDKNFQPISNSESTLTLSYFQSYNAVSKN